jgi:hypothetical protein
MLFQGAALMGAAHWRIQMNGFGELARTSIARLVLTAFFCGAFAPVVMADKEIAIGVIQYNAKGGKDHGWKSNPATLPSQVDLIANKIDSLSDPKNPGPIDFITLVQATDPALSDELQSRKLSGWKTVEGGCIGVDRNGVKYIEGTQIAYSQDWDLVKSATAANPLADDFHKSYCWTPGRPYNMAYFNNVKNGLNLLYIVVHFPHCYFGRDVKALRQCLDQWSGFDEFDSHVMQVTGAETLDDLKRIKVIISGDTNELGEAGAGSSPPFPADSDGYEQIFPRFGPLVVSTLDAPSCCGDNGWTSHFDRIVTNNPADKPQAFIIHPKTGDYPLLTPKPGHQNEEHKAIYGVVRFSLGGTRARQPKSEAR